MKLTAEQIEPCGCGGALMFAEIKYDAETRWQISCSSCGRATAQMPLKEKAVEAWNSRSSLRVQDGVMSDKDMVLVPREPTEEMIEAGCKLMLDRIRRRLKDDSDAPGLVSGLKEMWKAMLAAAPRVPEGVMTKTVPVELIDRLRGWDSGYWAGALPPEVIKDLRDAADALAAAPEAAPHQKAGQSTGEKK